MKNRSNSVLTAAAMILAAGSIFDARRHMKVSSPIFNEISGKLGGAVGMTSRFGMQLRGLITPNNPDTGPQFIVRNIAASLSSMWQTVLTPTQRASWTNLAEDTPGASDGKGLFVAANSLRLRMDSADAPVVLTAPATPSAVFNDYPDNFALENDAGTKLLRFSFPADAAFTDSWAVTDGGAIAVYLSRPQRSTRLTKIKPNVYLTHYKGDTTEADRPGGAQSLQLFDPASDPPEFDAGFAALDAGDVCYVTFQATDSTGRITAKYTQRLTCVDV